MAGSVPGKTGYDTEMTIAIRPMTLDDIAQVYAIELSAYPFPWTEQILRDCLRVGYSCWVVELDDTLVGYVIYSMAAGEAHILNLCVDPMYQRRGLGQQVLQHVIEQLRQQPIDTLFLEVRVSNTPAQQLYEKLGFNEIGRRKQYYPAQGGREDALMYALHLIATQAS